MRPAKQHMDLLTEESLRGLLAEQTEACVSIFLPTHLMGAETQQDPIRLKNLLREAEKQLTEIGMRSADAHALLRPLHDLVKDSWFWQHQSEGLALFVTRGLLRRYRLPLRFEELVVVGGRFHLKPLLPMLVGDGRFYVLALSQGGIRLLQGTRHMLDEVGLKGVPRSLAEALQHDEFERAVQFHTGTSAGGGDRAAMFHGHGTSGDEANLKKYILRFFHQLDRAVCECLAGERSPLVLAGVEYIRALYREANHYASLMSQGVDGNPDKLSAQELHQRGWETVAPSFQKERGDAVARFRRLLGARDQRVGGDIETVVPAAYFKRVETLFVPIGLRCWGFFDPNTCEVQVDSEWRPGDEDLLNFALTHTLRNGGTVYAVAPDEMPGPGPVAAVFFN